MTTVVIVVHLMVVLAMIGLVLLQRSEGGALGIGGGSGAFMTGRSAANVLTRATAILAALFFVTSLGLTIMASYGRAPGSILDGAAPAPGGNVLEQLQRMQGEQAAPPPATGIPAPAAPATPAAPQVPQSQ